MNYIDLEFFMNCLCDIEDSLTLKVDQLTGKHKVHLSDKADNWCIEMVEDCHPDGGSSNFKTLDLLRKINRTAIGIIEEINSWGGYEEQFKQQVISDVLDPYISNKELLEWLNGVPNVVRWIDMAVKQWRDLACSAKTLLEYAHAAHVRFLVDTMFKHILKQMEKEASETLGKEAIK